MAAVDLTEAGTHDLITIAALAEKIWRQHYPAIIPQDQIDYMLQMMYSQKSLKKQIVEDNHVFKLISYNNAQCGFISYSLHSDKMSLHKFYIDQEIAGKGVGTMVLKSLENSVRPKEIRLTVNRQNYKSVNFYFKNGFTIESIADFDIGNGYFMNDFVMVRKP